MSNHLLTNLSQLPLSISSNFEPADIEFIAECLASHYQANYKSELNYRFTADDSQIYFSGQTPEELKCHLKLLQRLQTIGFSCPIGLHLIHKQTTDHPFQKILAMFLSSGEEEIRDKGGSKADLDVVTCLKFRLDPKDINQFEIPELNWVGFELFLLSY